MRIVSIVCAVFLFAAAACRDGETEEKLPDVTVTCPVCGLEFNAKESVATRTHNGKTYYFLVEDHARAFAENPEAYLKK